MVESFIRGDLCYTIPLIFMSLYTGNGIRHVSANLSSEPAEKSHNIELVSLKENKNIGSVIDNLKKFFN